MSFIIVTSPPAGPVLDSWNASLDQSDFASHYTSPAFLIEPYFAGKNPFAVLAVDASGVVLGVATGLRSATQITCGASGSPHVCIRRGVDQAAVSAALLDGVESHARNGGSELTEIYAWEPLAAAKARGFRVSQCRAPLGTIVLDLTHGAEGLFKEFSETRRNKVRRAIRANVEVTEFDIERDFDAYYEIYLHWCSFKHLPPQACDVQRKVLAMPGHRLALVARHEGQIIGVSTFRYRDPGVMEYAANVSRREQTKVRQNDLLIWRAVEWACARKGISLFSMAGAHFFLQKFGGEMRSTYRYRKDRTLFRRHDLADFGRTIVVKSYQALPDSVRSRLKRLLNKSDEPG